MELKIKKLDDILQPVEELLNQPVNSAQELEEWLKKRGEIYALYEEDFAWRYINMTRNTENEEYAKEYEFFVKEIDPVVKKYFHKLNEKVFHSPYLQQINDKYYTLVRAIKREIEIFRERNLPLFSEEEHLASQFGKITGAMTILYKGKEMTLQQASNYLMSKDRKEREEVFRLIHKRRLQDKDKLNSLLDELIKLRTRIAQNAGFENFRDYKHFQLQRFDYTVEDVYQFHESIKEVVVPLTDKFMEIRRKMLKIETLKPWDLKADLFGMEPLKPFETAEELIEKSIKCLSEVKPQYGEYLKLMNEKGFLDLESRKGKAPGGYNYPLLRSNVPFIFMNASGNIRDVVTLLHEAGHAIHAFLTKDLPLVELRETPSEVAELASMSMELISMEHWHVFFDNEKDLIRAKLSHLEDILSVLPWIATVDKFQHLIYINYNHSTVQRYMFWGETFDRFSSAKVDWQTAEWEFLNTWQKQLHIFEVPFYYIEYAFAQLGAIAIWKNYKQTPQKALEQYEEALKLGYSKTIPEIYETAGIKFDFSKEYVQDLMNFVLKEIDEILSRL